MENDYYVQQKPTLSMGQAVSNVFNKYASIRGRARRSEYWFFWLFCFLTFFVAIFLDNAFGIASAYTGYGPIYSIVVLGLFIPTWTVAIRRLHDINKSGWNILWALVPIVGVILLIIWFCTDSDKSVNDYGESPKYI